MEQPDGCLPRGEVCWDSSGMQHLPAAGDWQDAVLTERLRGLPYTKRREEARLARWTAKNAVALALGLDPNPRQLRDIVIRNAPDGAPEATIGGEPLDAVIAMTDRADWAVCAVMGGTRRVGCDLELVEPRSPAFVRDYFTPAEQDAIHTAQEPHATANLLWSAKESALKVLRTGLRRDTRSVEVSLGGDTDGDWQSLAVADIEGGCFPGWWKRCGSFLLTVVAEESFSAPRSLSEPAPLNSAVPTHGWQDNPYTPG
jgi:4'-phosphopantetheinyl transferase